MFKWLDRLLMTAGEPKAAQLFETNGMVLAFHYR